MAYLKQSLEEGEIMGYSWILGEDILADIFTKQGYTGDVLEEMIKRISSDMYRQGTTGLNLKMKRFRSVTWL